MLIIINAIYISIAIFYIFIFICYYTKYGLKNYIMHFALLTFFLNKNNIKEICKPQFFYK